MLTKLLTNKKIWTILVTLLMLFTITYGLKYMGLYEGMSNAESNAVATDTDVTPTSKEQKIAKIYSF